VERLKIHHINIIVLSLLLLFNFFNGFLQEMGILYYVYYVLPFFIVLVAYFLCRKYYIDSYLLLLASVFSILAGEWGNLSGAVFLCFFFYSIRDNTAIIITLICTLVAIVAKMCMDVNGTITRTISYIIGYTYILTMYFLLIHPKKNNVNRLNEDEINLTIIDLLISGYRTKEIADKVFLSQNAVTKRITKMREKYSCKNNEQLVLCFIRKGNLGLN